MTGKRILKAVLALVIVAGFVLGGVAIYQAGFAHGAVTNLVQPEGSEVPVVPFRHVPYAYGFGPRIGLLGLFPLLCFGGFIVLLLLFGFSFFARQRSWMRCDPKAYHHWKHYERQRWESDKPPRTEDKPQAEPDTHPADPEESKNG